MGIGAPLITGLVKRNLICQCMYDYIHVRTSKFSMH